MIPKKLTLLIGSRLAIPVRAIPFITGWGMSPDVLAKSLAREPGRGLRRIFAYHLENGHPVKILPKEWDAVVTRLNALSAALKIAFPDESYLQWKKHSIAEFPEGVFVWLDEFESNFKSDSLFQVTTRVGDDELNLAPMLTDDVRKMIFAGFESFIQQEPVPAFPPDAPLPESTPEPAQQSEPVPALPASEPVQDVAVPTVPPAAPTPASELVKPGGVTTTQIVEAFGHLVSIDLGSTMTDKSKWTADARLTTGKRGKSESTWNPVVLATALHERYKTPVTKLDQAFNTHAFLVDWREEWERFSSM